VGGGGGGCRGEWCGWRALSLHTLRHTSRDSGIPVHVPHVVGQGLYATAFQLMFLSTTLPVELFNDSSSKAETTAKEHPAADRQLGSDITSVIK
jgi:hypothetical protein